MDLSRPDTDELIDRACRGERTAREELLGRHRDRLRQMVVVRMAPHLAARVDPSDVVQEALAEAARNLSDYLRERPLPFYPWLRRLAWERLVDLARYHVRSRRRSVAREFSPAICLSDESVMSLARRLVDRGSSPSQHLLREEQRRRVRDALGRLDERDREVLVLRYLEQLSTAETSAVIGLSEGAVKSRVLRALVRLRGLLEADTGDEAP